MLFVYFFAFYAAVHAVGGQTALVPVMLAMPAVDLAAALPVSVSGLGVREKVFETLMAWLTGLPSSISVAASLLGWLCQVLWGLIGGGFFILGSKRPTAAPQ
jgi:glycosyltransferase 2 family protein